MQSENTATLVPFYAAILSAMKKRVASLEGDILVIFYYLSASEVWPDKRCWPMVGGAFIREELYC